MRVIDGELYDNHALVIEPELYNLATCIDSRFGREEACRVKFTHSLGSAALGKSQFEAMWKPPEAGQLIGTSRYEIRQTCAGVEVAYNEPVVKLLRDRTNFNVFRGALQIAWHEKFIIEPALHQMRAQRLLRFAKMTPEGYMNIIHDLDFSGKRGRRQQVPREQQLQLCLCLLEGSLDDCGHETEESSLEKHETGWYMSRLMDILPEVRAYNEGPRHAQ